MKRVKIISKPPEIYVRGKVGAKGNTFYGYSVKDLLRRVKNIVICELKK